MAEVSALNANGEGPISDSSGAGAAIQTVPEPMAAPTRGSLTSETQLEIQWVFLTSFAARGGATITSYNLQWDAGTGLTTWSDLAGYTSSYLESHFTASTLVTPGGIYAARVRAYNAHGWAAFSPVTTIVASASPD